jgi:hypothetical protein
MDTDNSKNGMQTRAWGPPAWFFLHCVAQNYCVEKKEAYRSFFKLIGDILPCRFCRDSYKIFISSKDELNLDTNESIFENRKSFINWLYLLHNKINEKLKYKNKHSSDEVENYYEQFRSICIDPDKKLLGCTESAGKDSKRLKSVIKIIKVDHNGKPIPDCEFKPLSFGSKKVKKRKKVKKSKIKLISIKKSNHKGKKLMATFEINDRSRVVHFGFNNNTKNDYTKHHDVKRKANYIFRHYKDLRTGNPARAGYLSMFVLWNKPSLQASITDYSRRLNVYNKTGKFPTNISGYKSPGKKSKYQ